MRPFNEDKTWGSKQKKEYILDPQGNKIYDPVKKQYKCKSIPSTDWNDQSRAEEWRAAWAETVNKYLAHLNHAERIDHRSFERQGITDQIPTIHLGAAASGLEKRGIRTERGDINRGIEITNQKLRQIKARISKLEKWLDEESKTPEVPTLADVISDILNRREQTGQQSRYGAINNLKQAAAMLNFLTENNIMDMAGLENHLISMHNRQATVLDKLKPMECRLKTLDEHIKQANLYREHSPIHRVYQQQNSKHKDEFFEKNRAPLTLFQAAERYIKAHLNGRDKIPLVMWEKERTTLTTERQQLNSDYVSLRDEVRKIEKIARSVQDILYQERQREQPTRKRSQGLDR